jgi:hypothetical protein
MKNFELMENQTRNLTTFLTGVVIYTLFYTYLGSLDFTQNVFLKSLFGFFHYIILADAFAMAVIYKNFYKTTIFNEVRETIGSNTLNEEVKEKPIKKDKKPSKKSNNQMMLNSPMISNDETFDEMEGFVKNSALGNTYSTNGELNNI